MSLPQPLRPSLAPLAAFTLGALPWIAYTLWLTRVHPAIGAWNEQNVTPSPPPLAFAAGYGVILILALYGAVRADRLRSAEARLLFGWLALQTLSLYAPFALQRRMAFGLFFPMAALAARGWWSAFGATGRKRLAGAGLLLLTLPSNAIVVAAGLGGVARAEPALVITASEAATYEWFAEPARRGALVLAGPTNGNRLPAFADVRVVYGHPFETPQAEVQKAWVESIYRWDGAPEQALAEMRGRHIDYVVYGPEEAAIGAPNWLRDVGPVVFRSGGVSVYSVRAP